MAVRVNRTGRVSIITIDRPAARNSIDPEHNRLLAEAIEASEQDPKVLCTVLTGSGSSVFSAGADLKTLVSPAISEARSGGEPPWVLAGVTEDLMSRTKPIVAAVNGAAIAGGMELALACDIRIGSEDSKFGLAETKWGIIPGAGGTHRLPTAVPMGVAMEMILTGDVIDAKLAYQWGLISRITRRDNLLESAVEVAEKISARGPIAVREARAAVYSHYDNSDALKDERDRFYSVLGTDDALEGATAFSEKRNPIFKGC